MQTLEESLKILLSDSREPHAWEALASSVYQPLLAYVGSLLLTFRVGPSETAEDIVQEAMFRFYDLWQQGRLNLSSEDAVLKYLRRICRNLLIDKYRRERRASQLIDYLDLKFSSVFGDESDLYRSIFLNEVINHVPRDCSDLLREYLTDISLADLAEHRGEETNKFYTKWYNCLKNAKKIYSKKSGSRSLS
jgi:RNA polymerase sigma factor (sigma-70 family)